MLRRGGRGWKMKGRMLSRRGRVSEKDFIRKEVYNKRMKLKEKEQVEEKI